MLIHPRQVLLLAGALTALVVFGPPMSARAQGTAASPVQDAALSTRVKFVTEADGIREYRLANGMKVLLVENRVAPVATVLVVYKVGSRDEAVGYTGSTHLLEHLLFKGTPTFNKAKNTQIASTLQRIGARYNASTWYDRTNYYETVPSDQIELAIQVEADRMRNSFVADTDRQSEMSVVRNELERGQNEPTEVLDETVYASAFIAHPYHHPTIGWRSDVENVSTARLQQFYNTYYQPNNATAVVVGDFDRDKVLGLIDKYFGAYPASPQPIPPVYTQEPPQQGERRLVVRRAGELAIVQIAHRTPAALGQDTVLSDAQLAERAANPPPQNDTYALSVLSTVLTDGVTSRLYQALVEKQLAVSVRANSDEHRDPGLFNIVATVRPGVEPKKVEEVILAELSRIAGRAPDAAEVQKARQQILAQLAYGRDGTFNVASLISEAEAIADWRYYKDYGTNIDKVTPADVQRVAKTYFAQNGRTVGYFIPTTTPTTTVQPTATARPSDRIQFYSPASAEANSGSLAQAGPDSSAAPAKTIASRTVRSQLPNGATLLVLENHATPSVAIRGSLRAGSYFEPQNKPGLADVTAAMLERGTRKRTKLAFARDLESVGASIDFSSGNFGVNISGRTLSKDLPLVMDALSEALREPAFPAGELEKLKQQAIAAIKQQQANTSYRGYERFAGTVFEPTNPYYVPPAEQLIRSIQSITVADVRRFWQEHYGGRSLILAVTGDVQAADVQKRFASAFNTFSGPGNVEVTVTDPVPQTATRREVVVLKDKANVDILLGAAAPLRRDSKDYFAASLANSALGQSTLSSRLGLQVRDKEGLTYGISSSFRSPSLAAGPWYISVSVNPQNVERAIDSALGVLRDYVKNGIRPEELADEKSSAIGSFKVGLSTNAGLAQALWNAEFFNLGVDYPDRYPGLIGAVTVEEVNAAIRKYFRPEQLTVVIAGDYQPPQAGGGPTR
ncbi:MAG: insulinase family protein [Gemmatimonadaceae bacterium]|nr:insulinase family protein [Gloeobacterales cyanobacterium ES-bin-141]